MQQSDIIGHEFMGEVVEVGRGVAIAIDRFLERLEIAKKFAKAEAINSEEVNTGEALKQIRP